MTESAMKGEIRCDVAVIGAGVVGSAIARHLSHFDVDVALVEGGDDVGTGISKANSAILHTGFDASPGSLEASLVRRGHSLLNKYAAEVGIPIQQTGALVLAWSPEDVQHLKAVQRKATANNYQRSVELSSGDVYAREPELGPGVMAGLSIPDESVICPFSTTLGFATEAVQNGAALLLNSPVAQAARDEHGNWRFAAGRHLIVAKWVINAAGLRADEVARAFGDRSLDIRARRGEFVVYDKHAAGLVGSILLGVPTSRTKGMLVAPTVFGNVLAGPTAEDLDDKSATGTSAEGTKAILDHSRRLVPSLQHMEVTATYAGLRAVSSEGGIRVEVDGERGYGMAVGLRSTGLSASMAIAEILVADLADHGLQLAPRSGPARVTLPYLGEMGLRPYRDRVAIAEDPDAGRIVCFCEKTTKAELKATLRTPIPPGDIGGLFRRTRATGGRCQGFYCRAAITDWLAAATERRPEELLGLEGFR